TDVHDLVRDGEQCRHRRRHRPSRLPRSTGIGRRAPEERQGFQHPNLLVWVGDNRAKLLTAALLILRGYCAAGQPKQDLPAWGSFEGWSALVRSAVVWVGLPDPGQTRLLLQAQADV